MAQSRHGAGWVPLSIITAVEGTVSPGDHGTLCPAGPACGCLLPQQGSGESGMEPMSVGCFREGL